MVVLVFTVPVLAAAPALADVVFRQLPLVNASRLSAHLRPELQLSVGFVARLAVVLVSIGNLLVLGQTIKKVLFRLYFVVLVDLREDILLLVVRVLDVVLRELVNILLLENVLPLGAPADVYALTEEHYYTFCEFYF